MAINIIKNVSTHNTTYAPNRPIKYIVLHYTAGTHSEPGVAMANTQYYATASVEASADFFVDDGTIVQYNPNPKNYYCWSVGGKKYSWMTTNMGGSLYGIATNANCVNIEMCSCKVNRNSLSGDDTDWYLTDAVVEKAAQLTAYLMDLYNIDINHVIMHHHVTGKVCPNPWVVNQAATSKWTAFLARVKVIKGLGGVNEVVNNTPVVTKKNPDVKYQVYAKDQWFDNVINDSDYAGLEGYGISGVYANTMGSAAEAGNLKYRVHTLMVDGYLGLLTEKIMRESLIKKLMVFNLI